MTKFRDLNLKLSNREKEVLRWSAEGKTASEIALFYLLVREP